MEEMRAMNKRIIGTLVRLEGKFDDMAERMATKDDVAELRGQVAGLAGKVDDMRLDWAKHHVRLDDHEQRLGRLEHPGA